MRRSDLGAALAATAIASLALGGCTSSSDTPAPSPSSVEPAIAYAGAETPVVIRGSGFHVKAVVDVGGAARVDTGYRAWLGGLELADVRWIDTGTLTARVPPGLTRGRYDLAVAGPFGRGVLANAVEILSRPASLAIVSLAASPDPVNLAQDVSVEIGGSNSGGVDALDVAPSLAHDPAGAASSLEGPTPASATITAGGAATFAWRWVAAVHGALRFTGTAAGTDAVYGATVSATARDSAAIAVQRPATLAGGLVAPARVNVGQPFDVALALSNVGDAVAAGLEADLWISPDALVSTAPGPAPVDLAGSSSTILTRRFEALGIGDGLVQASTAGTDATDGRTLTLNLTKAIAVELPADLSALAEVVPSRPLRGFPFEVRVTVRNAGDAVALGVSPRAPAVLPGTAAAISPVFGPTRVSGDGDLSQSESVTFSWTFDALSAGTLGIAISAAGVDANDSATVNAAGHVWTEVVPEVQEVAANALGDGTSFAFVTAYDGDLVVGPSARGNRLVRMEPEGVSSRSLSLSFPRDVTGGNTSENHAEAAPPYRSIGYTGCTPDVADGCGPDDENGRGLLTSFTFEGQEWLLVAGARSGGDLDYVYVTRDTGTALSFSYVDLSQLLGGNTRGISAARVVGGRLYLGFPDNGGNRPYGTSVLQLQPGTGLDGLDAVPNVHAIDLRLDEAFKQAMTDEKFASISMVDAIGDLGGRVYFLSDVGCIVSKVAFPAGPTDFANCSPTPGAAYNRDQSVEPIRQYDLEPWEKAWPQVAVWNGRLYAIRNLVHPTLGRAAQLWSCDPEGGLDLVACEPGDWSLVAADGANLTRFGNPNATAASMLIATPRHLYVGFDDAVGGVRIYRTSAAVPLTPADFEGSGGCIADDPGCPGFGGNGLGAPAATTRVLDAKALQLGGATFVYVAAGNGAGPTRIVRLAE